MMNWGFFAGVLTTVLMTSWWPIPHGGAMPVHEMYANKSDTNRSVACGVCEARGGHLARRPALNDWEILFGNWSHLESMEFWVDLVKTTTGEWWWGDGIALNMSDIHSLPMNATYAANYPDRNCAVWNMAEPFLMPVDCSITANVLCDVNATQNPTCQNSELPGHKIDTTNAAVTLTEASAANVEECKNQCGTTTSCWAAHWTSIAGGGGTCSKLTGATAAERPSLPTLVKDAAFTTIGRTCLTFPLSDRSCPTFNADAANTTVDRTCLTYQEKAPEDSDFVCNCGAIKLPETAEEVAVFVAEFQEEVQRELIVPTDSLSATVRKKESAPDERQSSTSIGFLGITMLAVTFGSMLLLDIASLVKHFKMAFYNITDCCRRDTNTSDA